MEEYIIILFFILIILSGLVYFILRSRDLGDAIATLFIEDEPLPVYFEFMQRRLPSQYEAYLVRNEKYYRSLSPKMQRSYGSRIMKFMDDKVFETRDGLRLSWDMQLMIASAAVKITFGLRDYMLSRFHTIIVYPDEFYSKVARGMVKGETHGSGVIVFSWKDLKFGLDNSSDSLNLAYHEFAHALFIEHLMAPHEDEFKEHYREWLLYVHNNSMLRKVHQKQIFRSYAATNEVEFFAVALENFFERPEHFKQELPDLYNHMVEILNQDPTYVL